ncbi:MAG: PAS domain-containing protein [Deferribacteres bacterium]|nr:PAS domain-containing protein [Deferribacteres bacterium]
MPERFEESLQEIKSARTYADSILSSVPSGLIVLNHRLNILSVNRAFGKLNERFPSLSPERFIEPLKKEITANLETGETLNREIRLVPEGSETPLVFSATVSRIASGAEDYYEEEKASILVTINDITEHEKMRELVLQAKQDWEDTFNTIPDMITIHDRDYNIIHANRAARETLGLPLHPSGTMNKCYRYYHGADAAPDNCPCSGCYKTGQPATVEFFEPHLNRYIEIRSIPRINSNNEMIGLIHITRDISLRKEIEEEHTRLLTAITKAKIEWEMTFDSVMEFIVIINKRLEITRCNKSFADFVGKPVDEIIGKMCYDFFPCAREQVEECTQHMDCSRQLSAKNELKTDTGRWLYVSHRPIQDKDATSPHSVIIATEVTDLKNAQQKLRQSEEELRQKVQDLEKFYDMAVGREIRMKELKKEINKLHSELARYEEYRSVKQ